MTSELVFVSCTNGHGAASQRRIRHTDTFHKKGITLSEYIDLLNIWNAASTQSLEEFVKDTLLEGE